MNERKSFKEYTQRWRELAAQVEPPLSEKEMIGIFLDTLKDPFFDRLVSSTTSDFGHLITIGDRIKKGLKDGKIQGTVRASNTPKKYSRGFHKKKEGDTNSISRGYKGKQQIPYYQVATVILIPYQQPIQQNRLISNNLHNSDNNRIPLYNGSSNQVHHEGNLTFCMCLIAIYLYTCRKKDCLL